jgi:Domain of unknown function (DUF4288)
VSISGDRRSVTRPKPRLFIAVLVLQSRVGAWDDNPIVDHQIRIIRAANARVAYDRAVRLGESENSTYKSHEGQRVTWQFVGLSELDYLEEAQFQDGGEVFSWRTRGSAAEFVKKRSQLAVFARKQPPRS